MRLPDSASVIKAEAPVFLFDVDNTLLDSDRFKLDLSAPGPRLRQLRLLCSGDYTQSAIDLWAMRIISVVCSLFAGRDDDPLPLTSLSSY